MDLDVYCPSCHSKNIEMVNLSGPFYSVVCTNCTLRGIFALVQYNSPGCKPMDYSESTGGHREGDTQKKLVLVTITEIGGRV